jgi:hypothetical protein
MRVLAEAGECLRGNTASTPSSASCWRVRAMVARLVSSAVTIWLSLQGSPASPRVSLQQDAGLHQPLRGVFAAVDHAIQPFSLFQAELHHIFLYGDLFGGHKSTPSLRYGAIDSDILLAVDDGRY